MFEITLRPSPVPFGTRLGRAQYRTAPYLLEPSLHLTFHLIYWPSKRTEWPTETPHTAWTTGSLLFLAPMASHTGP